MLCSVQQTKIKYIIILKCLNVCDDVAEAEMISLSLLSFSFCPALECYSVFTMNYEVANTFSDSGFGDCIECQIKIASNSKSRQNIVSNVQVSLIKRTSGKLHEKRRIHTQQMINGKSNVGRSTSKQWSVQLFTATVDRKLQTKTSKRETPRDDTLHSPQKFYFKNKQEISNKIYIQSQSVQNFLLFYY